MGIGSSQRLTTVFTQAFGASIGVLGYATLLSSSVFAQIVPDGSLGAESSLVNPGNVNGATATVIDGGAARGANLFHSFSDFNVNAGQRVYFANPVDIENILSRVTGNNISNIDGLLGVDGNANLFLLNPNGVIFGPDARLDINGSFTTSTTNSFIFSDGSEFQAIPQVSELFTASVPLGVQFHNPNNLSQGDITSTGLLETGQNLTLVGNGLYLEGQLLTGGDLTLQAQDTVTIRDTATDAFVANTVRDLSIQGNQGINIRALQHLEQTPFVSGGDLRLISNGIVSGDAHYWSGGRFRVETVDGALGNLVSPLDPIIRTLGDVEIETYEGASLHILSGGAVRIGTAIITNPDPGILGGDFLRETVTLSDSTIVQVDGATQPTLDIRAGVDPNALGEPPFVALTGANNNTIDNFVGNAITNTPSNADIEIGDVFINAANGLVLLTNQYQPNSELTGNILITGEGALGNGIDVRGLAVFGNQGGEVFLDSRNNVLVTNSSIQTSGAGDVGDIILNAEETVKFTPGSFERLTGVYSGLLPNENGQGGNIQITAETLELDFATLSTTFGESLGNTGDIVINVRGRVTIKNNSQLTSQIEQQSPLDNNNLRRDTGNIEITAEILELFNNALLTTGSFEGIGNVGNIIIRARGRVTAEDGVTISSSVSQGFISISDNSPTVNENNNIQSNSGNIEITAETIEIGKLAGLLTTNSSSGNAGDIILNARGGVSFQGNNSRAAAITSGEGDAGNIKIIAETLEVLDEAFLSTRTFDAGDAGNIIVNTRGRVLFQGNSFAQSFTSSFSEESGAGGNIEITAETLEVLDGALLSSSTRDNGDAGDIIINSRGKVRFQGNDSGAISESFSFGSQRIEGNSGNIGITAGALEILDEASLSTSTSTEGDAGSIRINISDIGRKNSEDTDNLESSGLTVDSNSSILAQTTNIGEGGSITINTSQISLRQDAEISASTSGTGQGGSLFIYSNTPLTIQGPGQLSVETEQQNSGPAGSLRLAAPFITLDDGVQLSANSNSVQAGGTITISSPGEVLLNNSSSINSNANNAGDAGDIDITAGRSLIVDTGSRILAQTQNTGDSGNINLNTPEITLEQGAKVSASTSGVGQGGSLLVRSNPPLTIQGPGQLAVDAQGDNSGAAGTLTLNAPFAILDNGVQLSATSESDQGGGNLNFTVDEALILQQGSLINAESTNPNSGDGGNIAINTDFLIAVPNENNDIIANAIGGNGGRIEINANSIFGLTERSGLTTEELRSQPTSDLSASSTAGIQGDVVLNTLEVDPSQGLTELPADLIDRSNQVTAGCGIGNTNTQSTFVITGSGGLPPSPSDTATANQINVPWVTYTDDEATTTATNPTPTYDGPLVEAQQLTIDADGNAYFVASVPDATSSGLPHGAQCAANAVSSN